MKIDPVDQIRIRYEKRLKKVLQINDYIKYNRNQELGEIGSWILLSARGIKDGIKLLVEKGLSIYIHEKYGSAVFKWDHYNQEFICELWSFQTMLQNLKTQSIKDVKEKMKIYWNYCKYKKDNDLGELIDQESDGE